MIITDEALDAIERAAKEAGLGLKAWRVRGRDAEDGRAWDIMTELACINGLSALFTLATVYAPDEAEIGYTDGAIDNAEERAAFIAAANPAAVLALTAEVRDMRECYRVNGETIDRQYRENRALYVRAAEAERQRDQLRARINMPENDDWFAGVRVEAAHQIERWGAEHDVGKTPFDWFWLLSYLAQKAADAQVRGDLDKAKHHTISTSAALLNWHAAIKAVRSALPPATSAEGG